MSVATDSTDRPRDAAVSNDSSTGSNSQVLFLAGAFSGLAEALVVQPFDMIKTRHHLNHEKIETITETMVNVYREGGVLRFYRGITAELVGMIPKSSAMYASYELVRKFISDDMGYGDTSLVAAAAGLASGVPEALTVQPFQVVKVRLQVIAIYIIDSIAALKEGVMQSNIINN
jgi:hypothetical protein